MNTPSLLAGMLIVALHLTPSMQAQIEVLTRYEGRLLPILTVAKDGQCTVDDAGKRRVTLIGRVEVRPADGFVPGEVQVSNVQADLDPLKDASPAERAKPSSIRFRYTADIVSSTDIKDSFALLTLVANGSIATHLIPLPRLAPGRPREIKVELGGRVDTVGRLHVFAGAREIKSNLVSDAYDVREYYASLVQGARGVPAAALCRSENRYEHAIANDGNRLATVRRRDTHHSLIIYDLAAMKVIRDFKIGDKGESAWDLTWVSDHQLAYLTSDPRDWWQDNLMLLDVSTGSAEKLKSRIDNIRGTLPGQPDTLIIQRNNWTESWTARYHVPTRRVLNENDMEEGWTFYDQAGNERIRYVRDGSGLRFFHRPDPQRWWRRLDDDVKQPGLKFDFKGSETLERVADVHTVAPDGDTIYISSRLDSDRFELAAFSLARGEIVRTVAKHPRFDLNSGNDGYARLLFRKNSAELIGIFFDGHRAETRWLDAGYARVQEIIDQALPDHINAPLDWSESGNTFIYHSYNDRDPGTYYVFRPLEAKLIPILLLGEALQNQALGRMEYAPFPARDGTTIHAYLTRPPQAAAGPVPLVLYVHGGPTARDTWGYDATVQFLATRGYAVLQVNYRGSSGFGRAYQLAGLHARLDTVVLDDLADGVRHLIAQGIVDPQRVGVMGASFGGWATYMSLIKYPELYRAGIAISAVSHWRKTMRDDRVRFNNRMGYVFWKALLDREDFKEVEPHIDPYLRAAELRQPIYIMHGERDNVVHATEAKLMLDKLKKTNPHVESRSFVNATHSYWSYTDRITMLNEIGGFFDRHLGGAPTEGAAPAPAP